MALSDASAPGVESTSHSPADLEAFLAGLRHGWKEGEGRPPARRKPAAPRGRRRPDPLLSVTTALKSWFDADLSVTGRELLERLQSAHPETYPDGLLRTVQRRLKVWCRAHARALVFGKDTANGAPSIPDDALRNLEAARAIGDRHPNSTTPELAGSVQKEFR